MMEKRISPILILIIAAAVLEAIVSAVSFAKGSIGDSFITGFNLMTMKLDHPAEYTAEFDGYTEHTYYSDTGTGTTYKRAAFVYETEDGEQRYAESRLTDAERGSKLPQTVRVLDDGRNAFIKNDFDDMKRIALHGLTYVGISAAIPVITFIIAVIMFKIRKKRAAQSE